ncbi:hypothetical protein N1851_007768 [Merluccius polli]|uniref:Uncharacterized protein n=1 Tax=Merluccius polli TaxID=89951 RepID=A0AA47N2F6_MERPO|nr:hypothetical protein N1851_007768 [Merluccius polli]
MEGRHVASVAVLHRIAPRARPPPCAPREKKLLTRGARRLAELLTDGARRLADLLTDGRGAITGTTENNISKRAVCPVTEVYVSVEVFFFRAKQNRRRTMLSVDRNIVNDHIPSFISALCLMFESFYCFNIHYPSELASTLEFLQRCFFSINPGKGTKVEKTNTSRLTVNPRVLTLIQDLSDHEWCDV